MASFCLLVVLLAAAALPLHAHEQFFTADFKKNGSTTTVGSVNIVSWHNATTGWLNFTISLRPSAVGKLNVSKVSINDEGTDGELVLDLTEVADLAGIAATGTSSGTYEDVLPEIQHFTHQAGAHAFVIQTSTGTLIGETYQLLTASPGALAASLNSQNMSVGNATVSFKTNTSTLSTVSLAIVLIPPTKLIGTLKSVLVEEEDGSVKHDWTDYIDITTLDKYGETKGSFLLNTTEVDHLKEPGHYLSIKSEGGTARGSFSVPIAAAPAPAPPASSAFPLASAIAMRFFSSTAAILTLLSLAFN